MNYKRRQNKVQEGKIKYKRRQNKVQEGKIKERNVSM
jgi:hypothetical protein